MRLALGTFVLGLTLLLQAEGDRPAWAHGPAEEGGARDNETILSMTEGKVPKDWVEEKTGAYLPLELVFRDEDGRPVSLDEIVDKPTLLLPVYYYCAGSCSRNLASLAISVGRMKALPGRDFRIVSLSINDREKTEDARRAKKTFLKLAGGRVPEGEWRFLTGDREAIAALATAIGYRFERRADGTYIHPSALVTVAGDGRIIRYVYGDFIPGDVDMAVYDAGRGVPSLSVKRLLDICFNPDTNASRGVVLAVKSGVLAIFGALVAVLLILFRKRGAGHRDRFHGETK